MSRGPSDGDPLRWPTRGGSRSGRRVGEWLVAIFCLGVVLFSPLAIGLFDRGIAVRVLGVPLLYCYLFAAWAVLVALIAWAIDGHGNGRVRRTVDTPTQANEREGFDK
jgi:hypothetical protein